MHSLRAIGLSALLMALSACASTQPGARSPDAPDPGRPTAAVARTGRVTLASVALAGRVAWRSIATAGTALGAFVTGGATDAEKRWNDGAKATRHVARVEAASVRTAARR